VQSNFTLQFIDLTVYFIPGLLAVLSFLYYFHRDFLRGMTKRTSFSEIAIFASASYLIGIIIYQLSSLILTIHYLIFKKQILDDIVTSFTEIESIKKSIRSQLAIDNIDYIACYRYAQSIILEKYPQNALVADRLMAISLLCRNLLIAVPFSFITFFLYQIKKKGNWQSILIVGFFFVLLILLLYKAFLSYWCLSVLKTLRSYIIWSQLK
jgi:hypothetical protein